MMTKEEKSKDGLYTVYLLPYENYVGQTEHLQARLHAHKNRHSRDISDVVILGKYETREEARGVEDRLHSLGYLGYNNGK